MILDSSIDKLNEKYEFVRMAGNDSVIPIYKLKEKQDENTIN